MATVIHTTPKMRPSIQTPNWIQPIADDSGVTWIPSYAQAYQMKVGWELFIGDGWSKITHVSCKGDRPTIYCENTIGYQVDYLDAVKYRRPWWQGVQ